VFDHAGHRTGKEIVHGIISLGLYEATAEA
jgi:hypothetical protein